jgi:hypothetical protein
MYEAGYAITAFITFVACWIYAVAKYGFLIGVGLGWIPSLIVAAIAGAIWPLLALVFGAVVFFVVYSWSV